MCCCTLRLQGTINLHGVRVEPGDHKKYEHYFQLVSQHEVYHFAADTAEEMDEWVATLR